MGNKPDSASADTARADLNAVLLFAAVVDAGSFTSAAGRLGLAKGRVSEEVSRLERQLGVALLTRTTRQLALTQAGQALYDQYVPMLRNVRDGLPALGQRGGLAGSLCIGGSVEAMMRGIAPAAAAFAALHPQLEIELRASDVMLDLVHDGIDVFIRGGWLADSSLRVSQLGEFEQFIVASPGYLAQHEPIEAPEQLASHEWITYTPLPSPNQWHLTSPEGETRTVRTRGRIRVNSVPALRTLLCRGGGVSALDDATARPALDSGELVRVLPQWSLPRGGIYALYPPGRYVPPSARAFVDFLREQLPPMHRLRTPHATIAAADGGHRQEPFSARGAPP